MSDTSVAPPSAAPASAPAPSAPAHEVPINQNPTSSPNPVGSQAPDAPPDRAQTAREAIQRAYDRAANPQGKDAKASEKPAQPVAEAKKGHNQPPEETPEDKPARLNLKKPPTADIPRSERGQFAPRQPSVAQQAETGAPHNAADPNARGTNGTQPGPQGRTLPAHAPFAEPPQRIAEHARRDWADTPESVRGEIHRMHHEFGRAYQAYRADAEAMQPLKPFHQLAQSQGVRLEDAVRNYVNMEQKLRANPLAGLDLIVHNLGLVDPQTGQKIGLRDVAYSVLSQSPEQLQMLQQGNVQNAAAQQIGALHQEVRGLKSHLQQMHTAQQFAQTRSVVDQFALDHPRLDELGPAIEQELKAGYPLDVAYRRADLLYPATHAAQTRTPPAQTRSIDRSISGNPDVAPSNGASRKPQKPSGSARDAVQNAINRVQGMH